MLILPHFWATVTHIRITFCHNTHTLPLTSTLRQEGWQGFYLRFYEALSQLCRDKDLQALNERVSPKTAEDQQLLEWVQLCVPLSWETLPIGKHTHMHTLILILTASAQYKWRKQVYICDYLCVPVRPVAVKNPLEPLQMFGEALCQVSEVVQSAKGQDVKPGTFRQPTHCWVGQLLDGHPSR